MWIYLGIAELSLLVSTIFVLRDIPSELHPPEIDKIPTSEQPGKHPPETENLQPIPPADRENLQPIESDSIPTSDREKSLSLEEKARTITVKIVAGEFWGSGIIIARKDNTYTVLTNDHVLSEEITNYPIHTHDGKVYQGKVIASASKFEGQDLALLEFKSEEINYNLARFGKSPQAGEKVFAAGFPFPKLGEETKGWVLYKGVVWKMLDKPLYEGYQLGYTNEIEKGMSGGALLNSKGEVVAVNGMHAYPLIGRPYIYEDGTLPDDPLIDEMVHHSFGIPVNNIDSLF
ncbi:MAG: serine protease [Crocosphaera sp.]|nr:MULTISPECIES: serine protease [Crocosphaera]MCH2247789.1 serine protease [Crocosphaera sp.]